MSLFRPRKSTEEFRFRMQTEMQQANGVDAGYPAPKLCSHKAVVHYSRGEFDCLVKHLHEQTPSVWHFLAWSAYSNCTAPGVARRRCPLVRCNHTTIDDPDMLRAHVFSCAFLSDGRYWCDHCCREEKFIPFQCKDCPASPFRKDRLSQKAKKVFRWLGARSHPKDNSTSTLPTVDQKSTQWHYGYPTMRADFEPRSEMDVDTAVPELGNSRTAVELASYNDLPAELDSLSDVYPTARPNTVALEYQPYSIVANQYSSRTSFPMGMADARSMEAQLSERQDSQYYLGRRATSELHSNNGLSRLQSPISPLSPGWIPGQHNNTVPSSSPTETVCSQESLFSKSSSQSSVSSILSQHISEVHMPSDLSIHGRLSNSTITANAKTPNISEHPIRKPRSTEESERSCQHPDVLAEFLCARDCATLSGSNASLWLSPEDVVRDFWVVIEDQVEISMEKLRRLPSCAIVRDLLGMNTKVIATTGLETWRRILTGLIPTNVVDFLSLLHVTYACAMVINDCKVTRRLQQLFSHALLLGASALSCKDEEALYSNLVTTLWQPPVEPMTKHGRNVIKIDKNMAKSGGQLSRTLNFTHQGTFTNNKNAPAAIHALVDSGNKVFEILGDFLTLLEGVALSNKLALVNTPQQSHKWNAHFFRTVTQSIIDPLILHSVNSEPPLEAFISEIWKMESLAQIGQISCIREVEVWLIWSARRTIRSLSLYEKTSCLVKEVCLLSGVGDDTCQNERNLHGIEELHRKLNDLQLKLKNPLPNEPLPRRTNLSCKTSPTHLDESTFDGIRNPVSYEAPLRHAMEPERTNNATVKRRRFLAPYVADSSSPPTSPIETISQAAGSEQANHSCSVCGHRPKGDPKWFRGNLAKHMATHGKNKKFSCQYLGCGKLYGRSDNLRQHIKEHHSENRRAGDPESTPRWAESFGDNSGLSQDEGPLALDFDNLDQFLQPGPFSNNSPMQTYPLYPGDSRLFG